MLLARQTLRVCAEAATPTKTRPDVGILTAVIDEFEAQLKNIKVTGESFYAGRVFKVRFHI